MAESPSRKLAVLLHADVERSTALMRLDETLAHQRIQGAFRRFSELISRHDGIAHELRGDALVAEFSRASDALSAALAFQEENTAYNAALPDGVCPALRIGIAMGEVVIADNTVTGEGVVLAQRLEQLAEPGGVCLQGAAYETVPKRLPFAYERLGERELKGFDEPVRVYAVRPASRLSPSAPATPMQPEAMSPDVPVESSIAVLPFDNLSGDPEQDYFADGIAEDIITALSHYTNLLVVARNSSFTYRGSAVDMRKVGRELGVRYCLEGSVRKAGKRVRVAAQLIDTASGNHLWAERYDGSLEDVFAVQDEITQGVSAAVGRRILLSEMDRAAREERANSGAWELVLRAQWHLDRLDAENFEKALALATEATEKYPNDSGAHSTLAYIKMMSLLLGFGGGTMLEAASAVAASAKRAIALDPNNEFARGYLAFTLCMAGDHEGALAQATAAHDLNPSSALGLAALGMVHTFSGPPAYQRAVECWERAMRASPQDPLVHFWYALRGGGGILQRKLRDGAPLVQLSGGEKSTVTRTLPISGCHLGLARRQGACPGRVGRALARAAELRRGELSGSAAANVQARRRVSTPRRRPEASRDRRGKLRMTAVRRSG